MQLENMVLKGFHMENYAYLDDFLNFMIERKLVLAIDMSGTVCLIFISIKTGKGN